MLAGRRSEYHSGMEVARTTSKERIATLAQARDQFKEQHDQKLIESANLVLSKNTFFSQRSGTTNIEDVQAFSQLPLLRKTDLIGDDGYAANLTHDRSKYNRFHRTSGTTGHPLAVLDTETDWQWWMEGWSFVLDAGQISESDCVLMAFSFGPFVGFWSAFDAAVERDCLVIPTGAMNTYARLELIQSSGATVVFCTPSYALHMAQLARTNGIDLRKTSVAKIVVAGEPGGSVSEIRHRIESQWDAEVVDHAGATEVGPWGFANADGAGLYVNESLFHPEFLEAESGRLLVPDSPETEGKVCQLVLTTIGRFGCPVLRYVTGDLVKPSWKTDSPFVFLDGGVLGRADDMMIIRGVNVFPTSIEKILRSFDDVEEFQLIAWRDGQMDQLRVKVEDRLNQPDRIANEIQLRLGLRVDVDIVEPGSLPRFEMKGKRFLDQR
jgi:phenylacetate-CoA ligase